MSAGDKTFCLFRQMVEVNKTILRIKKSVPLYGSHLWSIWSSRRRGSRSISRTSSSTIAPSQVSTSITIAGSDARSPRQKIRQS